jgi:hypothetical protein
LYIGHSEVEGIPPGWSASFEDVAAVLGFRAEHALVTIINPRTSGRSPAENEPKTAVMTFFIHTSSHGP